MLFNVDGNKLCLNGKETKLTKDQMKELGLIEPSTFDEVEKGKSFYYVNACGLVRVAEAGKNYPADKELLETGNYNTNEKLMEQRALHETLDRLLWKYSIEKGYVYEENDGYEDSYEIRYDYDWDNHYWYCDTRRNNCDTYTFNGIRFNSEEDAEDAIKEVIEPFLKDHPDFVW